MRLKGKLALVTGGSERIGLSIAEALPREGVRRGVCALLTGKVPDSLRWRVGFRECEKGENGRGGNRREGAWTPPGIVRMLMTGES